MDSFHARKPLMDIFDDLNLVSIVMKASIRISFFKAESHLEFQPKFYGRRMRKRQKFTDKIYPKLKTMNCGITDDTNSSSRKTTMTTIY